MPTPGSCTDVIKPWGSTKRIGGDTWHASIKAGGYSSLHCHIEKLNWFHVQSGKLKIEVYGLFGLEVYTLTPDEPNLSVDPGVYHRFNAITDVELIEGYLDGNPDHEDIRRVTQGGCNANFSSNSCKARVQPVCA